MPVLPGCQNDRERLAEASLAEPWGRTAYRQLCRVGYPLGRGGSAASNKCRCPGRRTRSGAWGVCGAQSAPVSATLYHIARHTGSGVGALSTAMTGNVTMIECSLYNNRRMSGPPERPLAKERELTELLDGLQSEALYPTG